MNQNEVVVFKEEKIEIEVNFDAGKETVWLSQEQMAVLFDLQRPAITKHIKNIYASEELNEESTSSKMEHMGKLGVQSYMTTMYNLDMIISVGYRVNSKRGIIFRKWASNILK